MSGSTQKKKAPSEHVSGRAQRRLDEEKKSKQRKYMLFGGGAALAIIAAVVLIVISQTSNSDESEENPLLPDVVAAAPLSADVQHEGRVLGDPNAPVTLTVWADYQCPFCAQFSTGTMPLVIQDFVTSGKVKVEYMDLPFLDGNTGYGESDMAAEAAACAVDQNKFWEMHDTIYVNHYGENGGAYSAERLKEMAAATGLDAEQFNACFDERKYKDEVAAMQNLGEESGVNSTPTLFVNGERITWTGKYEDLKAEIERVLG
jgi:protein-disulfide isomerase